MTHKIYTVTDLGPGDGGKGGIVHAIAVQMKPHTIIKVGGAQGSHGVCTSRGERFAFSQWGCGTLEGTKTFLTERMVISPEGLLNEAEALRYTAGIHNPFALLTVDRRALCSTPFHGIASRLKELARGKVPRGTIGTGVGEATRDALEYPDLSLFAGDLLNGSLRDRLAAIREHQKITLADIISGPFLPADREAVNREVALLIDDAFLDYVSARFSQVRRELTIVDDYYLGETLLAQDGVAVVESSHGVLTDRYAGFHPHTSALRTLPCFTTAMLEAAGYRERIVRLGVTRAYQIRHGAGPMPTADPALAETLLPGSHKDENRYQGKVRVGPLDLVQLRYAIAAAGGPTQFDGLAVSWFDQIEVNGYWDVCHRYFTPDDDQYFTSAGEIIVRTGENHEQLVHQTQLGRYLEQCRPEISRHHGIGDLDRSDRAALCRVLLNQQLQVPVRLISFGPTERDKVLC